MPINKKLFTLRLCETREYSPRIIEHWLHTIQKTSEVTHFILRENKGKIEFLCSENLESHFIGSRSESTASDLKNRADDNTDARTIDPTNIRTHFQAVQTKGPLLPIKRHAQFEDRVQKTRIVPSSTLIREMAQIPGSFIRYSWKPLRKRTQERILRKAKNLSFEPERRFDQWETRGWLTLSLRRFLGPWIRKNLLHPPSANKREQTEQMESIHEREDPKHAVLDKLTRPLFQVTISLSHPFQAYWNGFTLPYLGELKAIRTKWKNQPALLSAEELATLLAVPNAKECAAHLHTEPTAYLAPPSDNPLCMSEEDRKRHIYIMGKTGMGKSTTFLELFLEDLNQKRTTVIFDPHGDLITDALKLIPEESKSRVILLDPSQTEFPLSINPVELKPGENANLKTSAMVEMFEALAKGSWGPRLEYILRNALLMLTLSPNTTLIDLPILLTDKQFGKKLLENVRDPELFRFFNDEFYALDERTRQEHCAPILNKVGPLLTTPLLRNIFGQPKSKFNFENAIANNKIVLIPLSKGKLGEDASRLLGMIFISMIQNALLKRADLAANERNTLCVYLDEFQNFSTRTLLGMLAESRKYGLALTLANQYLTQVAPEIQDAVLGNVGSLIAFRTSYQDAEILAPTLGLIEEDLTELAPFQAYARLLKDQSPLPLFRLETLPFAPTAAWNTETIRDCSLQRYGRPKPLVEEKILERYNNRRKIHPSRSKAEATQRS